MMGKFAPSKYKQVACDKADALHTVAVQISHDKGEAVDEVVVQALVDAM